jgi:deoxyribonuclease-4
MPVNGGLQVAITGGEAIGCTAVQLFTANPKQWHNPPLAEDNIEAFRAAQAASNIRFLCAHDSYLVNLAAPEPKVLNASMRAFAHELERADQLGIPWVVTHMGAHLGSGEDEGLQRLIASVQRLLEESSGMAAGIALETTAGQGTGLGYTFEQLARVLNGVAPSERLGVCVDTCHIYAAGYDIRSPEGYEVVIRQLSEFIGLDRIKVLHCNDAKKPLGSRVDRHEHIGRGEIGLDAFERIVNDERLAHIPIIVETPEAENMHRENVALLRSLIRSEP